MLADAGFATVNLEPLGLYRETIAYREADGTLLVPDDLTTAPGTMVAGERVGMVIPQRLAPPREPFTGLTSERILFGHGAGIFEDASSALRESLAGARRRLPRALVSHLGTDLRRFLAVLRN